MAGLVPAIPFINATPCRPNRGARQIGERSDAVLRTAMAGHDMPESTMSNAHHLRRADLLPDPPCRGEQMIVLIALPYELNADR
jgi:hypothetical protein